MKAYCSLLLLLSGLLVSAQNRAWIEYPLPKEGLGAVRQIAYGHDRLWLVASGKLWAYNGAEYEKPLDSLLPAATVRCIWLTDSGLYLGLMSGGLAHYQVPKRHLLFPFDPDHGYPPLPDLRVDKIFRENDTSLWIQNHHRGFTIVHKRLPRWYNFDPREGAPSGDRGVGIVTEVAPYPDKPGLFVVSTLEGLFVLDLPKAKWLRHYPLNQAPTNEPGLYLGNESALRSMLVLGDTAWLGTWGSGLLKLDLNTGEYARFLPSRGSSQSIIADNIRAIWASNNHLPEMIAIREGVLSLSAENNFDTLKAPNHLLGSSRWLTRYSCSLGTFYGGNERLWLHSEQSVPWRFLKPGSNLVDIDLADSRYLLQRSAEDAQGALFDTLKALRLPIPAEIDLNYTSLVKLNQNSLALVGVRTVHLWRNQSWRKLNLFWRSEKPVQGEITSHWWDPHGNKLWLGTKSRGVFAFDPSTEKWSSYLEKPFLRYWVKGFNRWGDSLWALGEQHLVRLNAPGRGQVLPFSHFADLPRGAIASQVSWTSPKLCWVLFNRQGLCLLDWERKVVLRRLLPNELGVERLSAFALSPQGVWLATSGGLALLPREGKPRLLNQAYGLNALSKVRFSNDSLLFLGTQGLALWTNPSLAGLNRKHPKPLLTDFRVMGQSQALASHIRLEHHQNWLEWQAVAADFSSPGKGQIQLQLNPFTKSWRSIGPDQSYSLSNLKPGTYRLLARTRLPGNDFGSAQILMEVELVPAWYQTWWFVVALIVLTGGLLYGLYRFRLQQITQKQALENRYLDQLRSLEMRMLRVQMNPHFIFNALNSVRYFVLKEERKTASEYLSRFARLLRFILRISKMERISLAEEIAAVKNYVEFEQIRFSRSFTFHLEIAPELPLERIAIQPMLIQPFLENAIWHGLMPLSGSEGRLTLQLSQGEGRLKISIDDNGVGRSAAAGNRKKTHKSYGLSITRERLSAWSRSSNKEASFALVDKEEMGQAAGTRVDLILPLEYLPAEAEEESEA